MRTLYDEHLEWISDAYTEYEKYFRRQDGTPWQECESCKKKFGRCFWNSECEHMVSARAKFLGKYAMWGFMDFVFAYANDPNIAIAKNVDLRIECEKKLAKWKANKPEPKTYLNKCIQCRQKFRAINTHREFCSDYCFDKWLYRDRHLPMVLK